MSDNGEWACANCTFVNEASEDKCGACEVPRAGRSQLKKSRELRKKKIEEDEEEEEEEEYAVRKTF
jgi:hypothetical protein